jgi:hypothetical protein
MAFSGLTAETSRHTEMEAELVRCTPAGGESRLPSAGPGGFKDAALVQLNQHGGSVGSTGCAIADATCSGAVSDATLAGRRCWGGGVRAGVARFHEFQGERRIRSARQSH